MRVLLPIFLAFTMITSTVVSVVQQMQGSVVCETKETKGDDADPETEKEDKSEVQSHYGFVALLKLQILSLICHVL